MVTLDARHLKFFDMFFMSEFDRAFLFNNIDIEDMKNRRKLIDELLEKANDEQLKLAYRPVP